MVAQVAVTFCFCLVVAGLAFLRGVRQREFRAREVRIARAVESRVVEERRRAA